MINAQTVTQIISDLQKKIKVPRSSIQLAKGYMQAMEAKHKKNKDEEKAKAAKNVINFLNKQNGN